MLHRKAGLLSLVHIDRLSASPVFLLFKILHAVYFNIHFSFSQLSQIISTYLPTQLHLLCLFLIKKNIKVKLKSENKNKQNKNCQAKQKAHKHTQKNGVELFVGQLFLPWNLPGVWIIYPLSVHWIALMFPFPSSIANNFLVGGGSLFPFPVLTDWLLSNLVPWKSSVCYHQLFISCVFSPQPSNINHQIG